MHCINGAANITVINQLMFGAQGAVSPRCLKYMSCRIWADVSQDCTEEAFRKHSWETQRHGCSWKTGSHWEEGEVTKTTKDCIRDKNPNPVLSLATRITFLDPSPTRKFHSILVSIEEAIIIFPFSTVCSIQPRGSLSAPITASEQQTLQVSLPWKDAADNNS